MSENLEERYLYTVYPKKPIRNISENLPLLRVPKTLSLNKDEVLKCFDGGSSVYRRFSNEGIVEKINKYELERVHRAKYISREKWNTMQFEANKDVKVEDLKVNGTEEIIKEEVDKTEYTESKDKTVKVITTEKAPENATVKVDKVEDIETVISGYVEEVKEEAEAIPESTTTVYPDNGSNTTIDYSEINASEEINEEINETIDESSDIDESEDNDVVEEGNSESVEEESKTTSKVYVNYGGKKKKHH